MGLINAGHIYGAKKKWEYTVHRTWLSSESGFFGNLGRCGLAGLGERWCSAVVEAVEERRRSLRSAMVEGVALTRASQKQQPRYESLHRVID